MTTRSVPVYMGQLPSVKATDIIDQFLELGPELEDGETISDVAFTVTDADGATVAGAVTAHTESDTRTDFRVVVPEAGDYEIVALFTISDGQQFTRVARLVSV